MFCKKCGKDNSESNEFCIYCGERISNGVSSDTESLSSGDSTVEKTQMIAHQKRSNYY